VVEEGASVSLIEDYEAASPGQGLANAVTEILLGPGASAEHTSVLEGSTGGFHVGTVYVRQAAASRFTARTFALGGRLVRRDVRVVFAGEEAESSLDGLYVVTGTEHVDHHTLVDHAVPHCTSRELYKGVVAGESRAVWNGAVVIRPDAQKSDAAQSNMNLLLSADATVNTKPELQIFADDVKCSHGATVGQLDDDQLFYLRARGIGEASARALLTQAFAREIVERVSHDALRADLDARVARRMEAVANVGGAG
jgi:Fe-S cluster assembly protein SufD